jgi:hypothetical protein
MPTAQCERVSADGAIEGIANHFLVVRIGD